MDSPNRYKSTLSFVDLLFNILLGFVFLFLIAFLLINPIAKKGDIIVPAEYMIILTWPEKNRDDIDLWVKDSADNIVSFKGREAGLMHLDRDDLGSTNDRIIINGREKEIELNREVVTLRGIIPGFYLVSVHAYMKKDSTPIPINIEVIKLNPYSVVYNETRLIVNKGQIINFYTFHIDDKGEYSRVSETTETAVNIVNMKLY